MKTTIHLAAIGTAFPCITAGQNFRAKSVDHARGRHSKLTQKRLIGFHHAKFRIMQQHHILNGIEGIRPLAMRAQDFFHQLRVFHRQPQLMGDAG